MPYRNVVRVEVNARVGVEVVASEDCGALGAAGRLRREEHCTLSMPSHRLTHLSRFICVRFVWCVSTRYLCMCLSVLSFELLTLNDWREDCTYVGGGCRGSTVL